MYDGFSILDAGRLEEMVGGDEEFILEILQLYLDTSGPDVEALHRAAQTGAVDEVCRLAHTLKGASGNVGADAMMEMARRVELAAKEESTGPLLEEVERTRVVFGKTADRIRARLQV